MNKREFQFTLCGLFVGIIIGMVIFWAIAAPTQNAMKQKIQELSKTIQDGQKQMEEIARDSANLREANKNLQEAAMSSVQQNRQLMEQRNQLVQQATVLYEAAPQSPMAGLAGVLMGMKIPAQQGMAPRWFIPLRVKPIVYGDPQTVRVMYVDAQGRQEAGAPEILPQGVQ